MTAMVHHVGMTVRDLDRTTDFYRSLGAEVEVTTGGHFRGHHMDRGLGLPNVDLRTRMLRIGNVVLELLQYQSPPSEPYQLRNASIGAAHIAFTVDDLNSVYTGLSARGVQFFSPPTSIDDGPYQGGSWVYAKDPDGISVEFIQPGTKPALPSEEA
jgi:catechol 2,3-dioxygenase-like lactoylglutathione lyase family enzyme